MSGPPVENRNTLVSQKRVQRYSFFLNWPNISTKKMHFFCTFFVTYWKYALYKIRDFGGILGCFGEICYRTCFRAQSASIYYNIKERVRAHIRIKKERHSEEHLSCALVLQIIELLLIVWRTLSYLSSGTSYITPDSDSLYRGAKVLIFFDITKFFRNKVILNFR